MKKVHSTFIAALLAISLLLSVCPTAFAARFPDVPSGIGDPYLDAINYVSDNGILIGDDEGMFLPNNSITREQFAMVLFRVSGDTGTYDDASCFEDIVPNSYYYNAIGWAVNKGITNGISDTEFGPKLSLTREQQITFLYRLAGVMGYDRTADEDLTQASDYNIVPYFAEDAFSWAYEYGIMTRTSLTEAVQPRITADRKDTALFIARFYQNVQGIVFGRDTFSFLNMDSHFVSGAGTTYLISENDWNTFLEHARNENVTESRLIDTANREWNGSCYGMSIATILDCIGKIDLNGNYCNGADTLYEIPKLSQLNNSKHKLTTDVHVSSITISEAESKINFYQNTYRIPSVTKWIRYIDTSTTLKGMVDDLEYSGIGVFAYGFYKSNGSKGYHAVVAYGKPVKTSYGYMIALYDCRDNTQARWLQITTTSSKWTGKVVYTSSGIQKEEPIFECRFQNDFSVYNQFDIDNYDNSEPTANETILEDYTILEVQATGDFTIINAEGETLIHSVSDEASISGTMTVSGSSFIPFGEDSPCAFLFLVDPSESYTCTAEEDGSVVAFYAITDGASDGAAVPTSLAEGDEITAILPTEYAD